MFNVGDEAEARKHKIEEVDTLPDNLGSKYVESTKTKFTEAEEKDVSNVKNVEASIIAGLKVISNKKRTDVPIISAALNKKANLAKNKVEKKVEVEFGSGVIYGSFCKDTVKVGNLELPKQEFGEIEEMEGEIFNKLKFSGNFFFV